MSGRLESVTNTEELMKYTINFKVYGVPDGELLDGNESGEPVELELTEDGGDDSPVEAAVRNMKSGDMSDFEVDPEEAFGEWSEEHVEKIPASHFADDAEFEVGSLYAFGDEDGEDTFFKVVAIEDDVVVCDFNHPLAGRRLKFEVSLLSVE